MNIHYDVVDGARDPIGGKSFPMNKDANGREIAQHIDHLCPARDWPCDAVHFPAGSFIEHDRHCRPNRWTTWQNTHICIQGATARALKDDVPGGAVIYHGCRREYVECQGFTIRRISAVAKKLGRRLPVKRVAIRSVQEDETTWVSPAGRIRKGLWIIAAGVCNGPAIGVDRKVAGDLRIGRVTEQGEPKEDEDPSNHNTKHI